jgi:predicted ATPase
MIRSMIDGDTAPLRRIETNWHVITGAPCSGKTSVIDLLGASGHWVVPEAARACIDRQLSRGATLASLKTDPLAFERHILRRKLAVEKALPPHRNIYFDRAVPDSIAYYRIEGLNPEEPLQASRTVSYRRVFLFERLPFEKDAVRVEDQQLAARIEWLLEESYTGLGYSVVRVPVMSIEQRAAFILQLSGRT